jgi:hypothetical protein
MLDGRMAAFRRRGVELPPPMVVADSWLSDAKRMRHVTTTHHGTFLVEGKSTDTVGELKSAEMCVSHMPSWKAKKLGKHTQEKVLLSWWT